MYSNVVLGLDHHMFEEILDDHKDALGVTLDTDLAAEDWTAWSHDYKACVESERGAAVSRKTREEQLWGAIGAVFASWMNERAKFYRRMHDIPESWGTAVNVQSMVFGNMGETSATGVAFTRNPLNRRGDALRRVPDQRPGRGRGRRHPHAAVDHQRPRRGRARRRRRWRRRCRRCSAS